MVLKKYLLLLQYNIIAYSLLKGENYSTIFLGNYDAFFQDYVFSVTFDQFKESVLNKS